MDNRKLCQSLDGKATEPDDDQADELERHEMEGQYSQRGIAHKVEEARRRVARKYLS